MNFSLYYLILLLVNCCFSYEKPTEKCKFTSKMIQSPYNTRIVFNVELIDICHVSTNQSFRMRSVYQDTDVSFEMNNGIIEYLKHTLTKFDIQVGKVLGKGNYGLVFAAVSKTYGKVAIKVAASTDGVFFDMNRKFECYAPSARSGSRCPHSLDKTVPFEVAGAILTKNVEGVVKSKAYGIITLNHRIVYYIIVMENIENSMTRKL